MIENFTSNLIPINMHGFLTKNFFINNKLQREINYANLWEKEIEKKILIKHLSKRKLTNFKNLHFLNQIHSSDVVEVKKLDFDKKISADAMVSSIPGVILCILTADCAPIIFYEKENNVIGIAHVGWRGAINGIIKKTLEKMIQIGAKKDKINVVIGPCIGKKNYEVRIDFFRTFVKENKKNEIFFKKSKRDTFFFNFPQYIKNLLHNENMRNFEFLNICTFEEDKKFFSYRRHILNKRNKNGRFLSYIRLNN